MKSNGDIITFLKQKDYIMINNNLGEGSFGKTVLLQDPFIDELFVAKMYSPEREDIKERYYKNFLAEIKIMHKLNHPNIVRIFNYYAYEKACTGYILMEYVDGETIEEFVENYDPLHDITLDGVFAQLIDGFCYIESHGIIHRDIREGNILIDRTGTVKIIDFGIGKEMESLYMWQEDSLVDEINRENSDTLPQEYFEGIYTAQTDMFYLAELFNRLLNKIDPAFNNFSYYEVLMKMMAKKPTERYNNFAEIKDGLGKKDYINMDISREDKETYQRFAGAIFSVISKFRGDPKFISEPNTFIQGLENALNNNLFEDYIQDIRDVMKSIIQSPYKYYTNKNIQCDVVRKFLTWYKKSNDEIQKIILANLVSKLSTIQIEYDYEELPFI